MGKKEEMESKTNQKTYCAATKNQGVCTSPILCSMLFCKNIENQSMAKDQADIVHNFDLGMFDGL